MALPTKPVAPITSYFHVYCSYNNKGIHQFHFNKDTACAGRTKETTIFPLFSGTLTCSFRRHQPRQVYRFFSSTPVSCPLDGRWRAYLLPYLISIAMCPHRCENAGNASVPAGRCLAIIVILTASPRQGHRPYSSHTITVNCRSPATARA